MDYSERKRWINAGIALSQNPTARVPCPTCASEPLSTEEIQAYTGHMEMHFHCRACGRGEWMLLKVASFDTGNRVELFEAHPDVPLSVGSKGIVHRVHDGRPARYEIEFVDDTGKTILIPGVSQTHLALNRGMLGSRKPRPDDASRPFAERAAAFILAGAPERPPSPPKVPHFEEAEAVSLIHALVGLPYPGGTHGVIRRASPGNPPTYLVAFPRRKPDDDGLHEVEEVYLDRVRPTP